MRTTATKTKRRAISPKIPPWRFAEIAATNDLRATLLKGIDGAYFSLIKNDRGVVTAVGVTDKNNRLFWKITMEKGEQLYGS